MKCCVSTDIGTWTNWLTFEPDPDHSPDAGTGSLSPVAYVLQRGILLSWENPYWATVAAVTRGFESYALQRGFYYVGKIPRTGIWRPSNQRRVVLRSQNTVVGGKCALPSALIVYIFSSRNSWYRWKRFATEVAFPSVYPSVTCVSCE